MRICHEIDDPATEVDALVTRAALERRQGRAIAARETCDAALATAGRVAYHGGEVEAHTLLAQVLADLGDRPAAEEAADRAASSARAGGYALLEADTLAVRARLRFAATPPAVSAVEC